MRVLALDIGERRVGVAGGDTASGVALPVATIETSGGQLADLPAFRRLVEDHGPKLLVVGLPLSLDGTEGAQAVRVRKVAGRLAERTGLPVVYQDERLTSVEAKRSLRQAGCTEREMRGKIDRVAASLILRAYFEAASRQKGKLEEHRDMVR
ncbi:MAG: Holliday junction resolvase RuvX [Coriobacteriales bacterium]|jgi:putative Holliday junction resolvase|nr:Holliday junction resolvase RuvX [Coriobacteriales bacterium]